MHKDFTINQCDLPFSSLKSSEIRNKNLLETRLLPPNPPVGGSSFNVFKPYDMSEYRNLATIQVGTIATLLRSKNSLPEEVKDFQTLPTPPFDISLNSQSLFNNYPNDNNAFHMDQDSVKNLHNIPSLFGASQNNFFPINFFSQGLPINTSNAYKAQTPDQVSFDSQNTVKAHLNQTLVNKTQERSADNIDQFFIPNNAHGFLTESENLNLYKSKEEARFKPYNFPSQKELLPFIQCNRFERESDRVFTPSPYLF